MPSPAITSAIKTDPNSPTHDYLQLAEILRQQIQRGEITSQLPSAKKLEKKTGLANTTVRRAFAVLMREGLVQTVSGRGTFVTTERQRQQVPRRRRHVTSRAEDA
jgi:DNA-binding GntR family transcriptional regulator